MPITHQKVSGISDGSDSTLIQPSDWNAAHTMPSYSELANGWQYVILGADFVTSSATAVDVTGMAFTPSAGKSYEIEAQFLLRTATATIGPRPGCAWPTGCTDGVISFQTTSAAGANVLQNGNISASVLSPVGGLPSTTASFPGSAWGVLIAGASPSGTFKIQLASETAGTNVTMKAGSFLKYRMMN